MNLVKSLFSFLTAVSIAASGCSSVINNTPKNNIQVISPHSFVIPGSSWMPSKHKSCGVENYYTKKTKDDDSYGFVKLFGPKSVDHFEDCEKYHIGNFVTFLPNNSYVMTSSTQYVLHTDSKEIYATVTLKKNNNTISILRCELYESVSCNLVYDTGRIFGPSVNKNVCNMDLDETSSKYKTMRLNRCLQIYGEELKAAEISKRGLSLLRIIEQEQGLNYLP